MTTNSNLVYNDTLARKNKKSRRNRFALFVFICVALVAVLSIVAYNQFSYELRVSQAMTSKEAPQEDIDKMLNHMKSQYAKNFTLVENSATQSGASYVYTNIRCRDDEGNECGVSMSVDAYSDEPTEKFSDDYQVILVNKKGTEIVKSLLPNISSAYYSASYMGSTDDTTRYYTDPKDVFNDRHYSVSITARLNRSSNTEEFCQKILQVWPNAYARVCVTGEDENGYTACDMEYQIENGTYITTKEKRYDTSKNPTFGFTPSKYK